MNPAVRTVFESHPAQVQERLLAMRELVYEVAEELEISLEEALRWGQPSYLCKSGSTLRLHSTKSGEPAVFVHCQTTLVAEFREHHPTLQFEGSRALVLPLEEELPRQALHDCIARTLTYKLRKRG